MELSQNEKRALSVILEHISGYKAINKKATELPLYHILLPSHTLEEVIEAYNKLSLDLVSEEDILNSYLYSALAKTRKLWSFATLDNLHNSSLGQVYISLTSLGIEDTLISLNVNSHNISTTKEHQQALIKLTKTKL